MDEIIGRVYLAMHISESTKEVFASIKAQSYVWQPLRVSTNSANANSQVDIQVEYLRKSVDE